MNTKTVYAAPNYQPLKGQFAHFTTAGGEIVSPCFAPPEYTGQPHTAPPDVVMVNQDSPQSAILDGEGVRVRLDPGLTGEHAPQNGRPLNISALTAGNGTTRETGLSTGWTIWDASIYQGAGPNNSFVLAAKAPPQP